MKLARSSLLVCEEQRRFRSLSGDEQLERLQTEHIDFYLLHSLRDPPGRSCSGCTVFDWAEKALATGPQRAISAFLSRPLRMFQEIIAAYDNWAMCHIPKQLHGREYQAGMRGLKYAQTRASPSWR